MNAWLARSYQLLPVVGSIVAHSSSCSVCVASGAVTRLDVLQQLRVTVGADFGVTELAVVAPAHLAAELHGHGLHAVADAQHRHARVPHGLRRAQLVVFVGAGMAGTGGTDALDAFGAG